MLLNEKRQTSEYLFGIEEREGLPTENVSASWNFSKVDVLLIQTGFIHLWDKTKGGKRLTYLDSIQSVMLTPSST